MTAGGGLRVVMLCTGNAARSVMAEAMLTARRPDVAVLGAGTHVIEGQPMSWRTRDAMEAVGVSADGHRSYQLRDRDADAADLIVAMAAEHVLYVRRQHPSAAAKTGTIKRLVRDLAPAGGEPLERRIAHLGLANVALEPWEDVHDPAGGDLDVFVDCAKELVPLVEALAELLP